MNEQVSKLFAKGTIYLIKTPVSGRLGVIGMWNLLMSGGLGIKYKTDCKEELWVVTVTKNRRRLRILHVDFWGYELLVRVNFDGRFDVLFDDNGPAVITRDEMRRMMLDGTLSGEWRSPRLKLHPEMAAAE